jgi:hypothetical protein
MDVRDIKVLPQRKRKGCQPTLEFEAGTGSICTDFSALQPHLPPHAALHADASATATADSDPLENDSAAVKGLSLDSLGIYACDTKRRQFEFLDHTADVQIHSWGESFAQVHEAILARFRLYPCACTQTPNPLTNIAGCGTSGGRDVQLHLRHKHSEGRHMLESYRVRNRPRSAFPPLQLHERLAVRVLRQRVPALDRQDNSLRFGQL